MRILFLNQFFWPDTAATGQLLSDVAEYLAGSGEAVEVICGSANYGGANTAPAPAVTITRLRTAEFSGSITGRIRSYLSFLGGSLWHGLRHSAPDVVVTLTTPPFISLVGLAIQKLRGAKHVIWEMDVYPDIAVDLGVLKPGIASRTLAWLADLPRRHADRVIVLGDCMRTRLLSHGLDEKKIFVAENWADCDARLSPVEPPPAIRPEGLSVIYSGNFGRAHDVETIARAMASLNGGDAGIQFMFGGGGSQQSWIRDFCEMNAVGSAKFLPYCERDELRARLTSGDIGLVTQRGDSVGAVVPSKSYGIMAAGRPVLFIGPRQSTTALMIERYGCGWHVDCNDVSGLVALLRRLNANKEEVCAAGERAYKAFVDHYQRSIGSARVAAALREGVECETASEMVNGNRAQRGSLDGSAERTRVPQNS
jgi:glycosyltransferase involved in cell wall biosynthesis